MAKKKKKKDRDFRLAIEPAKMLVFDMLAPFRAFVTGVFVSFFLGLPAVGWLIKALNHLVNFLGFIGELLD